MKLVYSFWTPPLKKRWANLDENLEDFEESTLRCMLLSILCAKKWGFRVEVVTDLEGEKLLHGMPFDKISTELEFLTYNNTWVEGKIMAMAIQKEPFIHIDWDVFLLKHKVVDIFKTFKEDLLVQSIDTKDYFAPNFMDEVAEMSALIKQSPNDIEHFHRLNDKQFNCGVMGFRNLALRDAFVKDFSKALRAVESHSKDFSIHVEQGVLFSLVKSGNYSYKTVLKSKGEANKIGYTHLLYLSKYTKENQEKIKNRIDTEFPEYKDFIKPKPKPPIQVVQTLNFSPMYSDDINPDFIRKIQRMYAVSFLYLRNQGVEVRLYADPIGNKILRNIPYHHRTVVNKIYNDRFWATIKFDSLKDYPEAIHVDGDAFVKDVSVLDYKGDFICQHKEEGDVYESAYNVQVNTMRPILNGHTKINFAYNCGVLGFNNKDFFNDYLKEAERLVDAFENHDPIKLVYDTTIKGAQPMLIVEQYLLSSMADQRDLKPSFIISEKEYPKHERLFNYSWGPGIWVESENYTHLMGPFKYGEQIQSELKKTLKELDPELSKIIENE